MACKGLLVFSPQRDLTGGDSQKTARTIASINKLKRRQWTVALSANLMLPLNDRRFLCNNPGHQKKGHQEATQGEDFSVIGSDGGSKLHPDYIPHAKDINIFFGFDPDDLKDSADSHTQLCSILDENNITELFCCGFTVEVMLFSLLKLRASRPRIILRVVTDGTQGSKDQSTQKAFSQLSGAGVALCEEVDPCLPATIPKSHFEIIQWFAYKEKSEDDFLTAEFDARQVVPVNHRVAIEKSVLKDLQSFSDGLKEVPVSTGTSSIHIQTLGNIQRQVKAFQAAHVQYHPVVLASQLGCPHILEAFRDHVVSTNDCVHPNGETLASVCIQQENIEVFQVLLDHTEDVAKTGHTYCDLNRANKANGITPLMWAIIKHDDVTVAGLVRQKFELNATSHWGSNAFMLAMAMSPDSLPRQWSRPVLAAHHSSATEGPPMCVCGRPHKDWGGIRALHKLQSPSPCENILLTLMSHPERYHGIGSPQGTSRGGYSALTPRLAASEYGGSGGVAILHQKDCLGWTALHFGARTGSLLLLDWTKLFPETKSLLKSFENINMTIRTNNELTPIQLAAWNGMDAVVHFLLDDPRVYPQQDMPQTQQPFALSPWREKLLKSEQPKIFMKDLPEGSMLPYHSFTPLDFALMRDFPVTARALVIAGFFANQCHGKLCQRLFFYGLMNEDYALCEGLLSFEENDVKLSVDVFSILQMVKYPGSCTYTFAHYSNPMPQPLFECVCGRCVCVVCRQTCHADCVRGGAAGKWIEDKEIVCGCAKDKCRGFLSVDPRETAGYKYVPKPVNTKGVVLNEDSDPALKKLILILAQNSHENWALDRISKGWRFARERNNDMKHHPGLLPFDVLSEEMRELNIQSAMETMKLIKAKGFELRSTPGVVSRCDEILEGYWPPVSEDLDLAAANFIPKPLATSEVTEMSAELYELVETIGNNKHQVWAQEVMKNGYVYCPARLSQQQQDQGLVKVSPLLVPWGFLTPSEQAMSRDDAEETVKVIQMVGFQVTAPEEATASLEKPLVRTRSQPMMSHAGSVKQFKADMLTIFLRSAARIGDVRVMSLALRGVAGIKPNIDGADRFGHTALYLAAKHSHISAVKLLLDHNADPCVADKNGIAPLSVCSYLGSKEVVSMLIADRKCVELSPEDHSNHTPLHYAAFAGHTEIVEILAKRQSEVATGGFDTVDVVVQTVAGVTRWFRKAGGKFRSASVQPERERSSSSKPRQSALTLAVRARRPDAIRALIAHGHDDPTARDGTDMSPYERALLRHARLVRSCQETKDTPVKFVSPIVQQREEIVQMSPSEPGARGKRRGSAVKWGAVAARLEVVPEKTKKAAPQRPQQKTFASSGQKATTLRAQLEEEKRWRGIVNTLNTSVHVKSERQMFALQSFLVQAFSFIVLIALFGMFTPSAPDFGVAPVAENAQSMRSHFEEEFLDIQTPQEWYEWGRTVFLGGDSSKFAKKETFDGEIATIFNTNYVLGPIKLQRTESRIIECDVPDQVLGCPQFCLSREYRPLDSSDVLYFNSSDFIGGAERLAALSNGSWIGNATREVLWEFVTYNPNENILSIVRLNTEYQSSGTIKPGVKVRSFRPFHSRFPPSRWFEMVMVLLVCLQVQITLRELKATQISRGRSWWTIHEIATAIGFFIMLVHDIWLFDELSDLVLDFGATTWLDNVNSVAESFQTQYDFMALMLLVLFLRLIKDLRLIPLWGPTVHSIITTCATPAVILFLAGLMGVMLCFAVAFHAAFGQELEAFYTLADSVFSLFTFGFTEAYGVLDDASLRWVVTLFFCTYVLAVIVLLNLFIGIISSAYPSAAKRSLEDWESHITQLMEAYVERRVQQRGVDLSKWNEGEFMLRDTSWYSRILIGMDGSNDHLQKMLMDARKAEEGERSEQTKLLELIKGALKDEQ